MVVGVKAGIRLHQNRFENTELGVYIEGSALNGSGVNLIEENRFVNDDISSDCGSIGTLQIARAEIRRNTFACRVVILQAKQDIFSSPMGSSENRIVIEGNQGTGVFVKDSNSISIRKNTLSYIFMELTDGAKIEGNLISKGTGIEIRTSRNVIVQENSVEDNSRDGIAVLLEGGTIKPSVTFLDNRILRNGGFGIATENLEYINTCKGNEVKENQKGDYGVGPLFGGQPSLALQQKCEGS